MKVNDSIVKCEGGSRPSCNIVRPCVSNKRSEKKHYRCDPKGCDLNLIWIKSKETLMEVRIRSDVQIDGRMLSLGAKD